MIRRLHSEPKLKFLSSINRTDSDRSVGIAAVPTTRFLRKCATDIKASILLDAGLICWSNYNTKEINTSRGQCIREFAYQQFLSSSSDRPSALHTIQSIRQYIDYSILAYKRRQSVSLQQECVRHTFPTAKQTLSPQGW